MSARLATRMFAKPWGRDRLPPPFINPSGARIGEVWFEPPAELDGLLVKYIFTSEALSVQVHPSEAQTLAAGLGRQGKEECWLVIDAEPGAALGIGFAKPLEADAMRAAALDGSIEHLLEWHRVKAGDFFYISANTVHVIGAGISLIEVQQNSDITYRLYDYGRPRELHLAEGVAVALGAAHPAKLRFHLGADGPLQLVEGPHFRLDRIEGGLPASVARRYAGGPALVIPLSGDVTIAGEPIARGECGLAASVAALKVPDGVKALIAATCGS